MGAGSVAFVTVRCYLWQVKQVLTDPRMGDAEKIMRRFLCSIAALLFLACPALFADTLWIDRSIYDNGIPGVDGRIYVGTYPGHLNDPTGQGPITPIVCLVYHLESPVGQGTKAPWIVSKDPLPLTDDYKKAAFLMMQFDTTANDQAMEAIHVAIWILMGETYFNGYDYESNPYFQKYQDLLATTDLSTYNFSGFYVLTPKDSSIQPFLMHQVSEPGTLALLGLGLVAVMGLCYRRGF